VPALPRRSGESASEPISSSSSPRHAFDVSDNAHRPEPVAIPAHAVLDSANGAWPLAVKLRRELEPVGDLLAQRRRLLPPRYRYAVRVSSTVEAPPGGGEYEESGRVEPGRVKPGRTRIGPARVPTDPLYSLRSLGHDWRP